MSCPHCPHCVASGAFGLIDPGDPALTTNWPTIKDEIDGLIRDGLVQRVGRRYELTAEGRKAVRPAGAAAAEAALDPDPPRHKRLHKSANATFGVCGAYAFRYADRRTGSGVEDWKDVTCPNCLSEHPGAL